MTWPLLHCVCWLPAVEVGLLTVIYRVHIATGCNNSNNNCMRQTQWLCQSRFSLGHKRQSDCRIRAGLGGYSLGHGWIRTATCGPSCTLKGRTGRDDAHPFAVTKKGKTSKLELQFKKFNDKFRSSSLRADIETASNNRDGEHWPVFRKLVRQQQVCTCFYVWCTCCTSHKMHATHHVLWPPSSSTMLKSCAKVIEERHYSTSSRVEAP